MMKDQQSTFDVAEHEKLFGLKELFASIATKLQDLFSIDCISLVFYDATKSHITKGYVSKMTLDGLSAQIETILNTISFSGITQKIFELEYPVLKLSQDWIAEFGEDHLPFYQTEFYSFHCYIPLENDGDRLGTFELHSRDKQLKEEALAFCCNIADLLSSLMADTEADEPKSDQPKEFLSNRKTDLQLAELTQALSLVEDRTGLIKVIKSNFNKYWGVTVTRLIESLNEEDNNSDNSLPKKMDSEGSLYSVKSPEIIKIDTLGSIKTGLNLLDQLGAANLSTLILLPLRHGVKSLGFVLAGLEHELAFDHTEEVCFLKTLVPISAVITMAFSNILAQEKLILLHAEIQESKQTIDSNGLFDMAEPVLEKTHPNILGISSGMQRVFGLMEKISLGETTVLILGETGTGKELIAKAIHNSSARKTNKMIMVNCAAIPANLIESELFGHEKGSFTGATERRIGKFELANKSTIFLDEVGELSLDMQVKLLRVLQEREIERVGGTTTISTDVRIISATNRNLFEEVEAGRFRLDLFYRLNVFPISLPPLRERKADIPILATFFLERITARSGKIIKGISRKAMSALVEYCWPGNVRELEHLIEREALLCQGPIIKEVNLPSASIGKLSAQPSASLVKTIMENERDHIFSALALCNGRISGSNGAAKILGVPATTLNSKIKKFKLSKQHRLE
jgi:transcriptional regulator with GAF, ATPase, and Fis domain